MTATDTSTGDTSEFYPGDAHLINPIVTTTSDSGAGSLREAIVFANINSSTTIRFNIPTTDPNFDPSIGTFTIRPTSPLPAVTGAGTVIDGTIQTAFTGNTNPRGPEIVLNGSLARAANGIKILAYSTVVKGLVINGFGAGVRIGGVPWPSSRSNRIEGNYIGTNATGDTAVPNGAGVSISIGGEDNVIGGSTAETRNIISGNRDAGISISGAGWRDPHASNNRVQGNYIGTDARGTTALGNHGAGVIIGYTAPGTSILGNVISGNERATSWYVGKEGNGAGVVIYGAGNSDSVVQGNFIGTAADGTSPLGNHGPGLYNDTYGQSSARPLFEGSRVGGTTPGAANTIAYNGGAGIAVVRGKNFDISANSIFSNAGLGIDVGADGVMPNDLGSSALNFPVLTGVFRSDTSIRVHGVLHSIPSSTFGIQLYASPSCDPSGHGEGSTFLRSTSVTTNSEGNVEFTADLPVVVPEGHVLTAIATHTSLATLFSEGHPVSRPYTTTSEFSGCVAGAVPGLLQFRSGQYSVYEHDGTATIIVTRTAYGSGTVTVNYATSDGAATADQDYRTTAGTLTFAAGETVKTFTVPILDDLDGERVQTVNLTLSDPTGGAMLGHPRTAVLTIRDNDPVREFLPLLHR